MVIFGGIAHVMWKIVTAEDRLTAAMEKNRSMKMDGLENHTIIRAQSESTEDFKKMISQAFQSLGDRRRLREEAWARFTFPSDSGAIPSDSKGAKENLDEVASGMTDIQDIICKQNKRNTQNKL